MQEKVEGIVIGIIGTLCLQGLSQLARLLFQRPAAPQPKNLPKLRNFPPPRFSKSKEHIWN